MHSDPHSASEIASPAAGLTPPEMSALLDAKDREIIRLRRQVVWFQRQIFGQKSERRMPEPEGVQGTLGEAFDVVPDDVAPAKKTRIAAHERASGRRTAISSMATMTLACSLTSRRCRSRSSPSPMTRRQD
jgi:hypothetical protein